MKKYLIILYLSLLVWGLYACSVSYKFSGTSIDYTKTKTVSIDKFPIRANYVWSPMEPMFYNTITDAFAQKTKLKVLKRDGDLQLAGEIVEYSQTNKSISSDGYSAQVQLKIAVNVRFVNNQNHEGTSSNDLAQQQNMIHPSNYLQFKKN